MLALVLVLVLTLAVVAVAVQVMDGAKVSYYKLGDHQPKGSFHVHMIKGCKQVDIMKESQRCDHATQTGQRNPATRPPRALPPPCRLSVHPFLGRLLRRKSRRSR